MSQTTSELEDAEKLLWGPVLIKEVFKRWAQGFEFSKDEPTGLLQHQGGPCAVLAPVQAFIVRCLLTKEKKPNCDWRQATEADSGDLLVQALATILEQVREKSDEDQKRPYVLCFLKEPSENQMEQDTTTDEQTETDSMQRFHTRLTLKSYSVLDELKKDLAEMLPVLQGECGVLLFLYSVILTKGPALIRSEMSDPDESLVDSVHGHGSQCLINLVITGSAVSHVWNNEQCVEGLTLRGISSQSTVGFLTLLEHLRYCQVGSFLKRPQYPVWILGSETHLTVLFSFNEDLVRPETDFELALRVFQHFDPEGNSFIATTLLQDVMNELNLVSDTEYVDMIKKKLDNEGLGIILQKDFLSEFFPTPNTPSTPDTFTLWHYNALHNSNPGNKVQYRKGQAVLLETDIASIADNNPMQTCLQTRWPTIEITWEGGGTVPSIN